MSSTVKKVPVAKQKEMICKEFELMCHINNREISHVRADSLTIIQCVFENTPCQVVADKIDFKVTDGEKWLFEVPRADVVGGWW
ncbi:MAG: hypothetical protein N2645_18420 [Clostridia bacterium]|nr:hypothetical protein [Clostridia bacterium]